MSRTYRKKGNATKHWGKQASRQSRVGNPFAFDREMPSCYKNAKRVRCAAANSMKWWFHSKDAAIEAAKYNWQERSETGKAQKFERAYRCHACNGYHLSTMDREAWHKRKEELARLQGLELDENGNFTEPKPLDRYPDTL